MKVRASSCSYLKYTLIPINMRVDKSEGAYLKSFPNEIITFNYDERVCGSVCLSNKFITRAHLSSL